MILTPLRSAFLYLSQKHAAAPYALMLLIFSGCSNHDLSFVIRYDEINGLMDGADVVFGDQLIGQVNEIGRAPNGEFDVHVSIDREKMPVITQSAHFAIMEHPNEDKGHVINLMAQNPSDPPIADDDIIQGTTELEGFAQTLKDMFSREWNNLSSKVEQLISGIDGSDIEKELAPIESEIDKLIKDIGTLSKDSKDKLQHDVLPEIKSQIDKLRKQLEQFGSEQSVDPLEEKLKRIEGSIEA
jgi:ElaB/YqjD/DUF883 family membrane-anchored ribosome-binding protein